MHRNKTKKDNNELMLITVFYRCIDKKQKKTMTSVNSSSSSLGAQKPKQKMTTSTSRHFLWVLQPYFERM